MNHRYILFYAEGDDPQWRDRKLQLSQSLTWLIAENWDSSNKPLPQPGDRPLELVRVDALHDPEKHAHSTHYRGSDWEVTRVETYSPDIPVGTKFTEIVICFCAYKPINDALVPLPDRIISADSFGGDDAKYQEYLATQPVG